MLPRRASQCLHLDEGLPQITDENISHQPPTQVLPTITETSEHPTLDNAPATQHLANMSTTAGSSHNGRGASFTQTNGGAPHQSPLRAPSSPQELDQVQVQDWDEEVEEDEAVVEEEELMRVQQKIERLQQEQESIMRRQAITQRAKAHRQQINRERARLTEL
jgi:hypothetical protein